MAIIVMLFVFHILGDKSRVLLSGEFPDYIHAVAANVSYLLARS